MGLDIGDSSITEFKKVILDSKLILWNGLVLLLTWGEKLGEVSALVRLRLSMSSCSRLQILVIHDQDRHYAFHFVHIHAFHTPPQVLQNDRTGTAQGWKARKVTW